MKRIAVIILSVIALISVIFVLASCSKSEPFNCDGCGRTITDGSKNTVVDSYGDKWSYCDDCYKQIKDMQQ